MKCQQILNLRSIPAASPSYSQGPCRFIKGILGGHHVIADLTLP